MKTRVFAAALAAFICALSGLSAEARPQHRTQHSVFRSGELVTVPTAAGIAITVAPEFAAPMQGFIADLVARGIRPKQIHCYSLAKSHKRNSWHKSGRACDFNGSANRYAAMNRHRVSDIAQKYGLRDGCDFGDCGHIDVGGRFAQQHRRVIAYRQL